MVTSELPKTHCRILNPKQRTASVRSPGSYICLVETPIAWLKELQKLPGSDSLRVSLSYPFYSHVIIQLLLESLDGLKNLNS